MMPDGENLKAEIADSISQIPAHDWDACAGTDNPFLSHAFLSALEKTGCTNADTGWQPYHLIIRNSCGTLCAAMPLFLKGHSYGEYVFDHAWADAYERAGGSYYPKLQSAVPFTPVTGPRLLIRNGEDSPALERALLRTAQKLSSELGVSSLHLTFMPEAQTVAAQDAGYLIRTDQQFHWHNRAYGSFEDFLSVLSSRKRKQIRKERKRVEEQGITFRFLKSDVIGEGDWDRFFDFYMDTGRRKWGSPYLNRAFFSRIGELMGDRILLLMCEHDGEAVAGALNFIGADTLYGRYWGCVESFDNLHFEACYYQAIDYAIAHGMAHVEAGAQGEHKLARGYEPQKTYSAHWIGNESFRSAVARYLEHERAEVDAHVDILTDHTPFKKG